MDQRTALEAVEGRGYQLLPSTRRCCPGGSGLLVAIRSQPTGKHFDPETVHIHLRDAQGVAKGRTLNLLSPGPVSDRVCPGRVILTDRFHKCVDFYTFGGSLEIIPAPDSQVYTLRSLAPVLDLVEEDETIANQLADEAVLLLAEAEVPWRHNELGFNRRLAEIAPLQLYLGVLESLLDQYEHYRSLKETYRDLCGVLRREKVWLASRGLWPDTPYLLERLLAPG